MVSSLHLTIGVAVVGLSIALKKTLSDLIVEDYRLLTGDDLRLWLTPLLHRNSSVWTSCGPPAIGFECANVIVPLDHYNTSDPRRVSLAVTRLPVSDRAQRLGSLFLNPGGPGVSAIQFIWLLGADVQRIFQGRYDIIAYDPRGVGMSEPTITCFASALDEHMFTIGSRDLALDLPVDWQTNATSVLHDLTRQLGIQTARIASFGKKCAARSGDEAAFIGTDAGVHDLDLISQFIDGRDGKINWWGFSSGAVFGQYLVKILPKERIGKVILDGVFDATVFRGYPEMVFVHGLEDIDKILYTFADACSAVGAAHCALAHLGSPQQILDHLRALIDSLYADPVSLDSDAPWPEIGRASDVRRLLYKRMKQMAGWPDLAQRLDAAITHTNMTPTVQGVGRLAPLIDASSPIRDPNMYIGRLIQCADSMPYSDTHQSPSISKLAELLFELGHNHTTWFADQQYTWGLCDSWQASTLARAKPTRYTGSFELDDDLDTPVLILSNTYDPVTPLSHARIVKDRMGRNARLVTQIGPSAVGHCVLSAVSFCTARLVRDYMLGVPPADEETYCEVDERAFDRFVDTLPRSAGGPLGEADRMLWDAWKDTAAKSHLIFSQ